MSGSRLPDDLEALRIRQSLLQMHKPHRFLEQTIYKFPQTHDLIKLTLSEKFDQSRFINDRGYLFDIDENNDKNDRRGISRSITLTEKSPAPGWKLNHCARVNAQLSSVSNLTEKSPVPGW